MCREDVADLHLEKNNSVTIAESTIVHSKSKIQMLVVEKASIKQELKILYKKQKVEDFNYSLEQTIQGKENQLRQTKELLNSNRKMRNEAKKDLVAAKRGLQMFENTISGLFYKKKVSLRTGEGYKFQLEYIRPCPKHNLVCGLNKKEKKQLKRIIPSLEDTSNCTKYLGIESYTP